MPKRTSAASDNACRVAIVTLDGHLAGAAYRAFDALAADDPRTNVTMHCAGEWKATPELLTRCHEDIARADIVIACMLFLDEHIQAILPALEARRDSCDAMVCFMSDGDIIKQFTQLYILEPAMRERLASLNPVASARVVGRLLEAQERDYWSPDDEMLEQIRNAGDELDDRLEGITEVAAA